MTTLPRRKIDELIALHEREPSLREVVVEGRDDKHFFEWFLNETGARAASVLDVASIEVPLQLLVERGLPDGERSRVIALADVLAGDGPAREQVTCVIDADFDYLLGIRRDCPPLLATDFAALECYAFDLRTVNKIRKLVLRGFGKSAQTVLEQLAGPLNELFLLRALNNLEQLGLDFKTPNASGFYKSLRVAPSGFKLDLEKYVTSILQSSDARMKKGEVLQKLARLRERLKLDVRFYINGHDFKEAFGLYVRQHKGFRNIDGEIAARALMSSLDLEMLLEHKLFQNVLQRVNAG